MRRCVLLVLVCACVARGWGAEPSGPASVTFALVGDSTVATHGGWGPAFLARLTAPASGTNFARNGSSTLSYRTRGYWAPVLAAKPTYILIQFGHNDMPGKGPDRETDPATTYRANLTRYCTEARASGAQLILVTSLVRRNFRAGQIDDALRPYADAARAVAHDLGAPLVDLHARSLALITRLGEQGSAAFSPISADGRPDRTHLSPAGGTAMAQLVITDLCAALPALATCFAPE